MSKRRSVGRLGLVVGVLTCSAALAATMSCSSSKRDFADGDGDSAAPDLGGGGAGVDTPEGGGHAGVDTSEGGGGDGGAGPTKQCVPNAAVCDGNRATTCNPEGTGYIGGLKCSSKQTCLDGACEEHECQPGARFCSGRTIRQCADNGLSSAEVEPCASTQYCDVAKRDLQSWDLRSGSARLRWSE